MLSDHNPLVYLRTQKDPRGKFARWIAELEAFDYNIQYIPAASNVKADALSRIKTAANHHLPDDRLEEHIYTLDISIGFNEQIKSEQNADEMILQAKQRILDGDSITNGPLRRGQKQLQIENSMLTKSGRPILPKNFRKYVVENYHSCAHHSAEKLYPMIKKNFFWPNMYQYIRHYVELCQICQKCKADKITPKAPLHPLLTPNKPMQFIALDVATFPTDADGY